MILDICYFTSLHSRLVYTYLQAAIVTKLTTLYTFGNSDSSHIYTSTYFSYQINLEYLIFPFNELVC